ncbi:hypothetical protein NQ317_014695 [Molorchus minor]|uniref:Peptidase M14 domain-containing protein n=1 Tax=Molorchus minor TaxID=1323400 RepID=A0ABQ9JIP6_9CUCU|nr:hypothetical protein NQ317_014695 [Molorchus minor]
MKFFGTPGGPPGRRRSRRLRKGPVRQLQGLPADPKDEQAFQVLKQLEQVDISDYDFWSPVVSIGKPTDILVPPTHVDEIEHMVATLQMDAKVLMENVQDDIDAEGMRPASVGGRFDWESYHTLDEYWDFLRDLPGQFPGVATLIQAGWSYQGRPLLGVRISYSPNNENNTIFIESNIHAREWITGAVTTYIINELLTSSEPSVRNLAETHDWYIFPVTNPDGFFFSYTSVKPYVEEDEDSLRTCFGVDPNRNWGYYWNSGGSSDNPCSDTYMGPEPFSDPSVRGLAEFVTTVGTRMVAYLSIHSFSQMFLIPYGFTTDHLDNYNETHAIGVAAAQSLARRYGTQYTVGNVPELLYIATGSSTDWAKGIYQTPIVYCYELRDTGRYGFILPPDQIIPTGEETLDSVVTIFEEYERLKQRN